jgi:transcriptional regulator with XRE-family HTH domain
MSVTLRLKELREVNGWSQAELARRAGVNQAIISRLESGTTKSVSFRNLEKLALAVGCSPGYLVKSTQPEPTRRLRKLGKRSASSRHP